MVNPRIREVKDKEEMDALVDDFVTQGWVIKDTGVNTVRIKKATWGSGAGWIVSLVLAFVLMWFTFGISWVIPIAYGIYSHYNASEMLIRTTGTQE